MRKLFYLLLIAFSISSCEKEEEVVTDITTLSSTVSIEDKFIGTFDMVYHSIPCKVEISDSSGYYVIDIIKNNPSDDIPNNARLVGEKTLYAISADESAEQLYIAPCSDECYSDDEHNIDSGAHVRFNDDGKLVITLPLYDTGASSTSFTITVYEN